MKSDNSGILKPGAVFEKYTVVKLLGRGGAGSVYLVRHNVLDTLFALKILAPEVAEKNRQFVDRFIREAKLACKIRHPNLIAVHDAGKNPASGLYYIVMDYVSGGSVRDLLRKEHRLAPERALRIITQVAAALVAAHEHHMVHRDIKPDNIMFAADGTVKLADMGIAKSTDEHDTMLTIAATVFGTPAYMSPEQAMDSRNVDCRADIYSLGIVFYEMLVGQRPFRGDSSIQILSQVVADAEVPDIRTVCPRICPELADLVAAMTAKKLPERIPDPETLLRRLEAIRLPAEPEPPAAADASDDASVTVTLPGRERPPAAPAAETEISKTLRMDDRFPGAPREPVDRAAPPLPRKNVLLPLGIALAVAVVAAAAGYLALRSWQSEPARPGTDSGAPRPVPFVTPTAVGAARKDGNATTAAQAEGAAARTGGNVGSAAPATGAAPAIAPDALKRGQVVLLGGASAFDAALKAALVKAFGSDKVSFQPAESMGRYKEKLQTVVKSAPSAVVVSFTGKYAEDNISKSSFENIIRNHADRFRDGGIPVVFVLAPEKEEDDEKLRFFNTATRELCKFKSIPLLDNADPSGADFPKTLKAMLQR